VQPEITETFEINESAYVPKYIPRKKTPKTEYIEINETPTEDITYVSKYIPKKKIETIQV